MIPIANPHRRNLLQQRYENRSPHQPPRERYAAFQDKRNPSPPQQQYYAQAPLPHMQQRYASSEQYAPQIHHAHPQQLLEQHNRQLQKQQQIVAKPPQRRRPEDPPSDIGGIHLCSRQLELREKRKLERASNERPFQTRSNVGEQREEPWEQPFAPSNRNDGATIAAMSSHHHHRTIAVEQSSPRKDYNPRDSLSAESLESQRALVRTMMKSKNASSSVSGSSNSPTAALLRRVLQKAASKDASLNSSNSKNQFRHRSIFKRNSGESMKKSVAPKPESSALKECLLPAASSTVVATLSLREDEETDEGCDAFLNSLTKEVIGQHSQLYASFVMAVAVTSSREQIMQDLRTSPKSKVVLDTTTLQQLHNYLKSFTEFRPVSQLINDKQYGKQKQRQHAKEEAGAADSTSGMMPTAAKGVNRKEEMGAAKDSNMLVRTEGTTKGQQLALPAGKKPSDNQVGTGDHEFNDLSMGERKPSENVVSQDSPLSSDHGENESDDIIIDTRSSDDTADPISYSRSSSSSIASSDAARKQRPQLSVQIPSAAVLDVDNRELSTASPPPAIMTAVNAPAHSTSSSSAVIPWVGVQLRSVTNAEREEFLTSSTSPWAGVTLRPVSRKNEETAFVDESFSGETDMPDVPPTMREGQASSKQEDQELHWGKIDEAGIVIRLKGDSQEGAGSKEYRIIVDRTMIRQVQNERGESKSLMTWKIPRDEIEQDGMTLNMPTLKVSLILKGGKGSRKVLCFEYAEDCLRFATAFYNMSESATNVARSVEATPQLIEVFDVATDVKSAVRVEPLNDEEQIVLERYRELRQVKPAKEALHETISAHGGSSTDNTKKSDLSRDELQIAEKYRKMLGLMLPLAAVQHRMRLDGVTSKVHDMIVSEAGKSAPPMIISAGELPSSPVSTFTTTTVAERSISDKLTETESTVAETYKLMLKRGIPADAVRHKMTRDQVDMKIAAVVFETDERDVPGDPGTNKDRKVYQTGSPLSSEDEMIAEKYRKMLKMMIPADGVRHKMTQDQIDAKIVAAVVGAEPVEPASGKMPAVATTKRAALSVDEESIASQYRKLLKFHVSKEAVHARMQKEGVSDKIISIVLGNSALTSKSSVSAQKISGSGSTGSNLINLHWNAMEDVPAGSVWETSKHATEPERSDISKLVELFQKKRPGAMHIERKHEVGSGAGKAKLLDLTRLNNISISLKAFKEFSHHELADIIGFLDPTRKIRGERAQFIRDLLPTMTEIKIIGDFSGSDDRLAPAELWFRNLRGIERLERKAQVIRTMEMFSAEAAEVRGNFRLLSQVCLQVMTSVKLQDLLGMVLRIGNVMNEGTRAGGAAGFRFDSLLRLTQTKTSDGKITVLDYLVTVFLAKGERDTLFLASDFPDCHMASRLLISDMTNEVKLLQMSLKQCKSELADLEREQTPSFPKLPNTPNLVDPRSKLFASILPIVGSSESAGAPMGPPKPSSEHFAKRDQFLAAIRDSKKDNKHVDIELKTLSLSSPTVENTLAGGIMRLQSFIETVDESFSRLEKQRDEALQACKDLSRYCGESGGISATTTLLDILTQFAKNVESALKEHERQQQNDARKQKAQEAKEVRSFANNDSVQLAEKDGLSLVLLVNDVLKNANPSFMEDFKKGRVLPNPSDPLKAIYERERKVAASGDRPLDIVSAIREREGSIDSQEIQLARSRFAGVSPMLDDSDSELNSDPAARSSANAIPSCRENAYRSDSKEEARASTAPIKEDQLQPEEIFSVKERALHLSAAAQQFSSKARVPMPISSTSKPRPPTRKRVSEVEYPATLPGEASTEGLLYAQATIPIVKPISPAHRKLNVSGAQTETESTSCVETKTTDIPELIKSDVVVPLVETATKICEAVVSTNGEPSVPCVLEHRQLNDFGAQAETELTSCVETKTTEILHMCGSLELIKSSVVVPLVETATKMCEAMVLANGDLSEPCVIEHRQLVGSGAHTETKSTSCVETKTTDILHACGSPELIKFDVMPALVETAKEICKAKVSAYGEPSIPWSPSSALSKVDASDNFITPKLGNESASRESSNDVEDSPIDASLSPDLTLSRSSTGSLSEVLRALAQIKKGAAKPCPKRVAETPPLPSKSPAKERKSLAYRAREKRQEKNSGLASPLDATPKARSPERRATVDATSSARSPERKAISDATPESTCSQSNPNESSTARLARERRIQKRMSR